MSDTNTRDRHRRRLALGAGAPEAVGATQAFAVISEGDVLAGRYRLVREIARGGMGSVFEAHDQKLDDHRVAIKVLPPELATAKKPKARMQKEALAAIKLTHPNILRLHSFEEDGTTVFLVMEYLDGESLEDATADRELTVDEVLEVARWVCPALDYAHRKGIVHRDIKPANLMYHTEAGHRTVKIADFGIAFVVKDSISRMTGLESAGTLLYIAPEQLQGQRPDGRADQYSLAASFYELLNGEPPFNGAGLSYQIVNTAPNSVQNVPDHVNAALLKALAKQPADRFATCAEFLDALEGRLTVTATDTVAATSPPAAADTAAPADTSATAVSEPTAVPSPRPAPPSQLPVIGAAVAAAVLIISVLASLGGAPQPGPHPVAPTVTQLAVAVEPTVTPPTASHRPVSPPPTTWQKPATPATPPTHPPAPTTHPPAPTERPSEPPSDALPTPPAVPTVPPKTTVVFTTVPAGAKIYCVEPDRLEIGKADDPITYDLPTAAYQFKCVLAGYEDETFPVLVPSSDEQYPVTLRLTKPATVAAYQSTPATRAPEPPVRSVATPKDTATDEQAIPPGMCKVVLQVVPPEATVEVDGKVVDGKQWGGYLTRPGLVKIAATLDGYLPQFRFCRLAAGEQQAVTFALQEKPRPVATDRKDTGDRAHELWMKREGLFIGISR